jgi:hypothetical protein
VENLVPLNPDQSCLFIDTKNYNIIIKYSLILLSLMVVYKSHEIVLAFWGQF